MPRRLARRVTRGRVRVGGAWLVEWAEGAGGDGEDLTVLGGNAGDCLTTSGRRR